MDFKYENGAKVVHKQFGFGMINGRITITGKILLKDTYTVAFSFGTKAVKEKELEKVTEEQWTSHLKTNY